MDRTFYLGLADDVLAGKTLSNDTCVKILSSPDIDIFPLLNAAYEIRKKYWANKVKIHIINNGQNGHCPEDCHYCAQAKSSKADIEEYPIKSDDEFLAEAKSAYERGAHCYCMVFAGRGPNDRRTEHLAKIIKSIKDKYPIEVCVSAGLLDAEKAKKLKEAGLDRLNHNLNTSESNYPNICTTHTFVDRLNTLTAARNAGIKLCSGMIVGMGEKELDIIDVALKLRELKAESIPINLLIPIAGNVLDRRINLIPEYCLRILCLFRFLNPEAEIRVAAGREINLRSLEVLALYPANSLFLDGYLNTKGSETNKTLQMIQDAGFAIESEFNLDEILSEKTPEMSMASDAVSQSLMKGLKELRPNINPGTITKKTAC